MAAAAAAAARAQQQKGVSVIGTVHEQYRHRQCMTHAASFDAIVGALSHILNGALQAEPLPTHLGACRHCHHCHWQPVRTAAGTSNRGCWRVHVPARAASPRPREGGAVARWGPRQAVVHRIGDARSGFQHGEQNAENGGNQLRLPRHVDGASL